MPHELSIGQLLGVIQKRVKQVYTEKQTPVPCGQTQLMALVVAAAMTTSARTHTCVAMHRG
jgi:hypothetical protein